MSPLSDRQVRANLADELAERVVAAAASALGLEITPEQAVIREASRDRGADYQSNAAMGLAKRLGRPGPEVAAELVGALEVADLCEAPVVAGPGFINLILRREWLQGHLTGLLRDERVGIPEVGEPRRVVVDYSAPNVAKEMHVGHLRSTIIGDALARMLAFAGHTVIRRNHIGDWGTPFGMLIERMIEEGGSDPSAGHSISDLGEFYAAARARFDEDPQFAARARARVVALQGGDAETRSVWHGLVAESERHFERVYALLGVLLGPGDVAGESTYQEHLADVVAELTERGLAVESDGALCIFPEGFAGRDGEPAPLILRKSDGGYTYDTTDLAALRHRVRDLAARELIYVVGAPQRLHFAMVFETAREAGWLERGVTVEHVAFGSVLGEDGKLLRTRAGTPVKLVALLDEAVTRAGEVLAERGAASEDLGGLARAIGIGAVKYADLSNDRDKDYVFSFERMLSLEGNTSVYLQYANARALSVLRRAGEKGWVAGDRCTLEHPAERELAVGLLRLPAAFEATLSDLRPHKLCTYLFGLAVAFSAFYEACPVLSAPDDETRSGRLALCGLTSRALTLGLSQLGIEAPERLASPTPRPA